MNSGFWHSKISSEYFCDGFGKILGKVSLFSSGDETYAASYNNKLLGIYIDMSSARSAVEIEHKTWMLTET